MNLTNEQWAHKALMNALTRAKKKTTPEQIKATLDRGAASAARWLTGEHPKAT